MTVVYEWDVETVSAADTEDFEEDEVIDHRHQPGYAMAKFEAAFAAPDGFKHRIVLVRDDDAGRSWAIVEDGKLPERFTDANGCDGARVPKVFINEVGRAAS